MSMTKPKPKTCRVCKAKFTPFLSTTKVCSIDCAIVLGRATTERLEARRKLIAKREHKQALEAIKRPQEWFDECKTIAQKYARVRDADDGCISCDKGPNWWGQWHGSHFMPAGNNKAVALNLFNIHKACSECNNHKSGNLVTYQDKLIEKIGIEKVEWLKSQKQTHRFDIDYLKRYKKVMGKRLRRLVKRKG
jgi:5-methylcytosine-specific restriction endonuclease McrA